MEEQSEYEVIDTAEEDYSEISSVASSDYEAEVFLSDIIGKVRDESVERDEIQKDVISKKKIEAIIEIFEKATDQLEGLPFDGWKHAEAETRGIADLLSSASTSLRRLFSKSDLDSDEKPEPQPTGRVQDDKPKPIKVPEVKLQAAIKRDLRTSAESSAGDTNFWMENSSKIGAFGLALLVVVIGIAMWVFRSVAFPSCDKLWHEFLTACASQVLDVAIRIG